MNTRIYFWVVFRALTVGAAITSGLVCNNADAQNNSGYYTDPNTGIVYRQVLRTVDRPVVETKMEQREQTVYRPQTVTETKPESRTVYTPVVEYKWEPRLHGRWNPFRRPTIAYHHVADTHWEARSEVVQRTNSRTEWVAEKRNIEVPQRIVRMQREQKVDYEPVGRVAPQQASPPTNVSSAIASRLRPLGTGTRVEALGPQTRIASSAVAGSRVATSMGRLTSDPPLRSASQGGLQATELYRAAPSVRGQALPPASGGTGIANLPSTLPFFR